MSTGGITMLSFEDFLDAHIYVQENKKFLSKHWHVDMLLPVISNHASNLAHMVGFENMDRTKVVALARQSMSAMIELAYASELPFDLRGYSGEQVIDTLNNIALTLPVRSIENEDIGSFWTLKQNLILAIGGGGKFSVLCESMLHGLGVGLKLRDNGVVMDFPALSN
jgi:hypothetical protein